MTSFTESLPPSQVTFCCEYYLTAHKIGQFGCRFWLKIHFCSRYLVTSSIYIMNKSVLCITLLKRVMDYLLPWKLNLRAWETGSPTMVFWLASSTGSKRISSHTNTISLYLKHGTPFFSVNSHICSIVYESRHM